MRRALPVANLENMKVAFADYMRHDDRVSIHGLAPKFRAAERGSLHSAASDVMDLANKKLLGHGVESITGESYRGGYFGEILALYVNMGDTYAPTIIYDVLADRFYVGGYGDWVEWRQDNKEYDIR